MITKTFLKNHEGKDIFWFDFVNKNGSSMRVTNFGAIIVSVKTPDKNGKLTESVLGFDNIDKYIGGHPHFGAIAGRFANRIKGGSFKLNGKEYNIPKNEGENTLHGGIKGFDKYVWDAEITGETLILKMTSPDGDQGFPGNMDVKLCFSFENDEVAIAYEAKADKDTLINLTNHSYFNLVGAKRDILDHEIWLDADKYTPTDKELIPTGEIADVSGTPLDFKEIHKIGERIDDISCEAIKICCGYDNNFVLNGSGMRKVGTLFAEENGRAMDIITDRPAVQIYTAQHMQKDMYGHDNILYGKCWGCCFETQGFPDAIHHENFPSCVLRKGEIFKSETRYKFYVK